jgi:peroxiredoxin
MTLVSGGLAAFAPQRWFNSAPLDPNAQTGRVVVVGTFQMLCPGCVTNGLPQLQRIHDHFDRKEVVVIGVHTVFEHHAAMTPVSLEAFIHEYRLTFPIAVDGHDDANGPSVGMLRLQLRGTPSLLVFDREDRLRLHQFGHVPDLAVGAAIQKLIGEAGNDAAVTNSQPTASTAGVCTTDGTCG